MTDYLERVFGPFFTDEIRYVELLVDEIPIRKRWDVLMEVYRRKEEGEKKIRLFVETLLDKMEEAEISEFCKVVSAELSTTRSIPTMRAVLRTGFAQFPQFSRKRSLRKSFVCNRDLCKLLTGSSLTR